MSAIGDEAGRLVTSIKAAGVAATLDPTQWVPLVSQEGAAALVGPPEVVMAGLSGSAHLEFPVHLGTNAPGNADDFETLWTALEALMGALPVRGEVGTSSKTVGDITLPTYAVTVNRRIQM